MLLHIHHRLGKMTKMKEPKNSDDNDEWTRIQAMVTMREVTRMHAAVSHG